MDKVCNIHAIQASLGLDTYYSSKDSNEILAGWNDKFAKNKEKRKNIIKHNERIFNP